MAGLAELLRKRIDTTGESLFAVSRDAEVPYAVLYRFYHGQHSIKLETVEKLLGYLGLEVAAKPARQGGRGCCAYEVAEAGLEPARE